MDNIEISIRNLMKTNNGAFKSDKQQSFLLAQTIGGEYCVGGSSFNKSWTDVYVLDEKGVVSQTRHNKSGVVVEKWNRDGNSETQIKNAKSLDRHNAKLDAHKAISIDAEKLYNRLCLAEFGYVPCRNMVDKCWSAISISENNTFFDMFQKEYGYSILSPNTTKEQNDFCIEMAKIYNDNLPIRDEWKEMYMNFSTKLMDIRCKVQQTYPTKMVYTFM